MNELLILEHEKASVSSFKRADQSAVYMFIVYISSHPDTITYY
jgi:hypothetical protein